MNTGHFLMAFALTAVVVSTTWSHEETRKLTLSADGIQGIEIESGAGILVVEGDGDQITVDATIRIREASREEAEEFLDRYMVLTLEKRGASAILRSFFEDGWEASWREKSIDLVVKLPKRLHVDVQDGSGAVTIRGVDGEVRVDDGSGSIDASDLGGDVRIDDGSGSVKIRNVKGNVTVDDGSGEITIMDVGGTVKVSDGSGSIDINGVAQDVIIRSSGSGGVSINNVKGRVERDDNRRQRD